MSPALQVDSLCFPLGPGFTREMQSGKSSLPATGLHPVPRYLNQWFSKCGPWTSRISITSKLVRNASSQAAHLSPSSQGLQGSVLMQPKGDDLCTPSRPGPPGVGMLPISQEDTFSVHHAAASRRPHSKRIGNVITTVFISKRTAGALLLSIWTDPDGYS